MNWFVDWLQALDAAMVSVILFVAFFVWLVFFHLRVEDKREGYPADRPGPLGGTRLTGGILPMPRPKTFVRPHGRPPTTTPRREPLRENEARPRRTVRGGRVVPERDGLIEGLGPAAWQAREDEPDLNIEGDAKIISLNKHDEYHVARGDPDPRGWPVFGSDGEEAGRVSDLWFNRAEFFLRYLEVTLKGTGERVFLPVFFSTVDRRRERVSATSMPGARMAMAPRRRADDVITMLEEDKINAFYAGGPFYGGTPTGGARA